MASEGKVVEVTQEGHVCTITLNRPEKKNAISDELGWAVVSAVADAARDDEVWVIALTGAGDAFIGSFATFLAEGLSEADALERASLYAALSTTRVGAQTSFLDRAAFEKEREKTAEGP